MRIVSILIIFLLKCYYHSEVFRGEVRPAYSSENTFIKIKLVNNQDNNTGKKFTFLVHEENADEDIQYSPLFLLAPLKTDRVQTEFKFNCENIFRSSSGYNKYFLRLIVNDTFFESGSILWPHVNKTRLFVPKGYTLRIFIGEITKVREVNLDPSDKLGVEKLSSVYRKNKEALEKRLSNDYVSPPQEKIKDLELGFADDAIVYQDVSLLLKKVNTWNKTNFAIRYRIEPNSISLLENSCD